MSETTEIIKKEEVNDNSMIEKDEKIEVPSKKVDDEDEDGLDQSHFVKVDEDSIENVMRID